VSLTVEIPAGVDDGMQVRLPGQGEPSGHGGPPGDCYCVIRVREHPLFEREGQHLFLQMPISYTQAALGAVIEVPTLGGPHTLNIPAGTQSGKMFTIKRLGAPNPHGGARGDLLVRVFVEVPKQLSKQEEELLRELAELEHSNVAPQRQTYLDKIKNYFSADKTAG
jgi:molecular chaperone DnaJ